MAGCIHLPYAPRNGITASEAALRLQHHGPNKVEGAKGLSVWTILLRQVSNSLTLVRASGSWPVDCLSTHCGCVTTAYTRSQVLVITMVLSFAIHDHIEGGVIAAVITLNIVVG